MCYSRMMEIIKLFLIFILDFSLSIQLNLPNPKYQWPLGSKSILFETRNRNHFSRDSDEDCYMFNDNLKKFSYDALSFGSDDIHYLETELRDDLEFKNLSLSMYVYPTGTPTGTLLHYVLGPEEKIRINFIMSHTVVSFRDEYANPTGLVATENLLKDNEWNHLYIERQFESGRIKIYVNGEQKVNVNDDFQKNIPIPTGGRLVIGNAITKDTNAGDQQFHGYLTCFQIYTDLIKESDIDNMWENCLPQNWKYKPPEFYLIPKGNVKCISDTPPPTPTPPVVQNLMTRNVLTNEKRWDEFRQQFNWETSHRTTGYFKMKARDSKPSVFSVGIVNATDTSVCTRLCMRIDGCKSFAMDEPTEDFVTCHMYNSVYSDLIADDGSVYYTIMNFG